MRARGQKCPAGGAFGSARGPTPPCEGAASAFVPGRTSEKWDYLLKQKDIEIFDKRLGEMSGLDLHIAVVEERAPGIDDGAANSSVHAGTQLDDCRDQRGVPGEVRDVESLRSGLPRAEYVSGTP